MTNPSNTPGDTLMSTLPKDPEELSHPELTQRFQELALRCFNKENLLNMAEEIISNHEDTIRNLRNEVDGLEAEIEALQKHIPEKPNQSHGPKRGY